MKGIIILGGEWYNGEIDTSNSYVIACDGAYNYAKQKNVSCNEFLGDFDTLGFIPSEKATAFNKDKDFSDGELALLKLFDLKVNAIEIYCGSGGRDDHYLTNLLFLQKCAKKKINCKFITNYTQVEYITKGEYFINNKNKKICSFVALSRRIVFDKSNGFKYNLRNVQIKRGDTLGISNVIENDNAFFKVNSGFGFFYIINNEINNGKII